MPLVGQQCSHTAEAPEPMFTTLLGGCGQTFVLHQSPDPFHCVYLGELSWLWRRAKISQRLSPGQGLGCMPQLSRTCAHHMLPSSSPVIYSNYGTTSLRKQ